MEQTTHPNPAMPQRLRSLHVGYRLFVMVAMPILLGIGAFTLFLAGPAAVADKLGPAAPGSIAGVVKDADGTPLATIEVSLYRQSSYAADS